MDNVVIRSQSDDWTRPVFWVKDNMQDKLQVNNDPVNPLYPQNILTLLTEKHIEDVYIRIIVNMDSFVKDIEGLWRAPFF